jgi:guanylate kinase
MEELEKRLRGRGTDPEDAIQKRLAQAKLEIEYAYSPEAVHDVKIKNDDLDRAYTEVEKFCLEEVKPSKS